jgi:selenocysteine lyase/cysteine desulfurase
VRTIELYERAEAAAEAEVVERVVEAVTPETRVVALTWVHSSTGVRLPVRAIADALAEVNAGRDEDERALLCVDGVHGFGVENLSPPELGCDFFVAGCHKWLFGPRGTGLVWGSPEAWPAASATIPSFTANGTPGSEMTPGGFHSFEHRWALAQAFEFHLRIGKSRVAGRIHRLNRELKEGLSSMGHVTLHTPGSGRLSAGLVCFSVDGLTPAAVVRALRRRGIVATVTPYEPSYARVGPGLLNTPAQVGKLLRAIRALA